jgi:hypothetical protein
MSELASEIDRTEGMYFFFRYWQLVKLKQLHNILFPRYEGPGATSRAAPVLLESSAT